VKALYKWIASVAAVIAAAFFVLKSLSKRKKPPARAPVNPVADVVAEEIADDLEDGIGKITTATDSDDPAKELADLGNMRSRR
jgi:hypothetical protein